MIALGVNSMKRKERYKVIRFYWENKSGSPQYTLKDTKRNDTIRDRFGFTQIMMESKAIWLAKQLNGKEARK